MNDDSQTQRDVAIRKDSCEGKPEQEGTQADIDRNQGNNPGSPQGESGGTPGGTGGNQGGGT
jgi:hypothetical protein